MPIGNAKTRDNADHLRAIGLRFEKDRLIVSLDDAREVSLPLTKYPTLLRATPAQRRGWEIVGDGDGFHWEALDLDLSASGLVSGHAETIPKPPRLTSRVRAARRGMKQHAT